MAGRHSSSSVSLPRSRRLVVILIALLSILLLLITLSSLPAARVTAPSTPTPLSYSFVSSLDHFLSHTPHPASDDTAVLSDFTRLDEEMGEIEDRRMYEDGGLGQGVVRVYVYEMPRKFTFDLLWLFRNTYRETRNLTSNGSPVHRLIEQDWGLCGFDQGVVRVYVYEMVRKFTFDLLWLFRNTYRETRNLTSNGSPVHRLIELHSIDYWLWADLIAPQSERLLKNVVRVHRQEEADLFYIPFFTTISFFLLEKQQCKALYREALKWVTDQPAWKRSEGRDHILPVHHPWSFKSVRRYMKTAIWLLPDMDSTGNWYKPGQVSLEKDLILPYVANVDLCDHKCMEESESKRSILLFFRGRLKRNAGGKIRAKLVDALTGVDDVVIEEGTAGEAGKQASQSGMRKSIFCLNPAGDTPSSARLFDAIVSGCIPVIVSDELELPFEGLLDYRKIVLFVSSSDAVQPGWLLKYLRSIDSTQIRKMRLHLAKYSRHFLYSHPAQPLGPEDLAWRMIAGKLVNIKLHTRRSQRVVKGSRSVCTCDCRRPNSTATSFPL